MRATWSLLMLLGCGDDEPAQTVLVRTDAAAPAPDCTIEIALAKLAWPQSVDCGRVVLLADGGVDEAEYQRAHACVADALASDTPFAVSKQEQGIDSLVHTGFVQKKPGGPIYMLESDSYGIQTVNEFHCEALRETSPCEPARYRLCFVCEEARNMGTVCRDSSP